MSAVNSFIGHGWRWPVEVDRGGFAWSPARLIWNRRCT